MIHASKIVRQGKGLAQALIHRGRVLELTWDTRGKARFSANDTTGAEVEVLLPDEQPLRGGDVLIASDGSLIAVKAARQPVLRVSHCEKHGNLMDIARAAYQLGKRGVAVGFEGTQLVIESNVEAKALLQQMHLLVSDDEGAFEPAGTVALTKYVPIAPQSIMIFKSGARPKPHECGHQGHDCDHHDHAPHP